MKVEMRRELGIGEDGCLSISGVSLFAFDLTPFMSYLQNLQRWMAECLEG